MDAFGAVLEGEIDEGIPLIDAGWHGSDQKVIDESLLELEALCMLTQFDNPRHLPRNGKKFNWDDFDKLPLAPEAAADRFTGCLYLLARDYPRSLALPKLVELLEAELMTGDSARVKLLDVIVFEHLGLHDQMSGLRPYLKHWWKNEKLKQFLVASNIKPW